ncbi:polysialyltransferase family glycosyltransferase [Pseudoroseomonas sp. WGS1072]|uniref:hypothetical protein n=1 Tax=Roseomonas sp. WGS1072 TaxID=3366816 RepID=UPI003BF2DC1F
MASPLRRIPLRRIIVTGDFLRPVEKGFRPSQTENIRWLYRLLRRHLGEASRLPVDCLSWDDGLDAAAFYAWFGAEPSAAGWAGFFDAGTVPAAVLETCEATFGDAIVVGFELAEWFKRTLSHLDIPYVDLNIHPVRFLPDVFFAVQTNDAEVFAALLSHHTDPEAFHGWADLVSATALKLRPDLALEAPALLVGQTSLDRSLVDGGRVVNLEDHAGAVRALLRRDGCVAFKPHPYNSGDFGLFRTGIPFRQVRMVRANAYALLAHPGLREVVGVSSSLLVEAPYFDTAARILHRSPFDLAGGRGAARPGQHLSLVDGLLETDVWRSILAPLLPVTRPDGWRFRLPANSLRLSLRNFWGFNELSTDFLVQLYQGGQARAG